MTNYSHKYFIYTLIGFVLLCLVSYVAQAQEPSAARQLSLQEAVTLAIHNNRDIKVSSLSIERSQQQIRIARSLYLPTISANAQVAHYFSQPVFFGFGQEGSDGKIPYGRFGGNDQALAALNVIQPLYAPSARAENIRSKLLEHESKFALSDKETEVAAYVKMLYLQILVLNERIHLQKESLGRNMKALQDARSLLAQGRALRVDTLRAYTSVKNLEPELLQLSNAIEVNKLQLRTQIGIDSLENFVLTDSLILPEADQKIPTEEEAFNEAKSKRGDIQAIALQASIKEQEIAIAKAGKRPTVSLAGQYLIQTQASQMNYFNAYYPSTTFIGAQVSVPIFSGNSNNAKVQQASLAQKQAVIQTENAYLQLRTEVKQVVSGLNETIARLQTRTTVKETAQMSYDITQYRYAKGVASRLELTDAELALSMAQSNYLEAVYDYLSARIALTRTTGRQ